MIYLAGLGTPLRREMEQIIIRVKQHSVHHHILLYHSTKQWIHYSLITSYFEHNFKSPITLSILSLNLFWVSALTTAHILLHSSLVTDPFSIIRIWFMNLATKLPEIKTTSYLVLWGFRTSTLLNQPDRPRSQNTHFKTMKPIHWCSNIRR